MRQIILDTNVLVAALRSRRGAAQALLRQVGQGLFRVNISVALALEYEEVLKRANLVPGLSVTEIDGFLDYLLQASNLVPSVHAARPRLSDPDDEMVLDLAMQIGATILTYNKRDFVGAVERGVEVLTPAEFLNFRRQAN